MICGICSRGPHSSVAALCVHASRHHPGESRTKWQPGFEYKRPRRASTAAEVVAGAPTPPPQADGVTTYDQNGENRRTWPPADDRHNADKLGALPWLRHPNDEATCKRIVFVCDAVLGDSRIDDLTKTFFSSLRGYIAALRDRLRVTA